MTSTMFKVIDADSKKALYETGALDPSKAFHWGDNYVQDNPGLDYYIVDQWGNPIPRSDIKYYTPV